MKLEDIAELAKVFAATDDVLSGIVTSWEDEKAALLKRYMPRILTAVHRAATAKEALRAAVEESPEQFAKSRTLTFHGIKVGFRKGTGSIDWDDCAKVVEMIRKQFSKPKADLLIKVTEKPISKALANLDVSTLKALGCRVESTGDVVVVKNTVSEITKVVEALLKSTAEDEDEGDK